VRGKLLGLCTLVGIATLGGPMLLAIVRVGLAGSFSEALELAGILPRTFAVGAVFTLSLVMPAAAMGALLRKRGPAMAAFAAYHMLIVPMVTAFANFLDAPQLLMLSTWEDVLAVGRVLLGRSGGPDDLGPALGILGLGLFLAGGYWAIRWRVSSAERAGVGGGS
jgi:hypothetical protein